MCCFSQPVRSVTSTRIFARPFDGARQVLAYQMSYSAAKDLAMILPIPVVEGTGENGVQFINLKGYPSFFEDLERGFPQPVPARDPRVSALPPTSAAPLKVQTVGDFIASFVPTVADFSRLDPQFRLPEATWKKLPAYASFGFAVFKLKADGKSVHPMAFRFPRRDRASLFFPTVHIHDGEVRKEAKFDHVLYCQHAPMTKVNVRGWRESARNASAFMDVKLAEGLIDADHHCYRKELVGNLPNLDTFLPVLV